MEVSKGYTRSLGFRVMGSPQTQLFGKPSLCASAAEVFFHKAVSAHLPLE